MEPTACEVLVDGAWYPGWVLRWRKDPDGWQGYVRWTRGVGLQHLGWYHERDLRPR